MLDLHGPISGLLHHLANGRLLRVLTDLDQPARQLPAPAIEQKPMPPQHQHPVPIVDQNRHGRPAQMHRMMLEPLPIRDLDIHQT